MQEPAASVQAIAALLVPRALRDLEGVRIVVTAGPTHEPIDPVRYLGNRSSGKMGFAIAVRAIARGAHVDLISGPVSQKTPPDVVRHDVETAQDMRTALGTILGDDLGGADALVMAAAVADYRPAVRGVAKIKKSGGEPAPLVFAHNPDLIGEIGARRTGSRPVLVAFALETGDDAHVLDYATKKLTAKKVDLVVANAAHHSLGRRPAALPCLGRKARRPSNSPARRIFPIGSSISSHPVLRASAC
jgi:phosphopantothenoylcysteine decarboxylase/phosphopantothenate--cysteine ligase